MSSQSGFSRQRLALAYAVAVLATLAVIFLDFRFGLKAGERALAIELVFPVVLSAYLGGLIPGLVSTVIGVWGYAYLLSTPGLSFQFRHPGDLVRAVSLVAIGILISGLYEAMHRARFLAESRRIKQEEQLAVREQLARIAENAPGVLLSFRQRPDGSTCFPFAGPGIEQLYGIPAETLARDAGPLFAIIDPEDARKVNADIAESARNMTPWHGEFRINHPNRGELWVEGHSTPKREADGGIIWHGFVADVTARKRAEQEATHQRERFRATFEQAAVGIAFVSPEGRWLRVNSRLCQLTGYTRDELVDKTFQDITSPEDLEADLHLSQQLLAGEIPTYSMEKRYIRKDGSLIWVNLTVSLVRKADGEPHYFIAVIDDISERKQAAERLRQQGSLLDLAPVLVRDMDDRITFWGREIERTYGFSAQEALGAVSHELLKTAFPEPPEKIRQELLATGQWQGELRHVARDGRIITVISHWTLYRDRSGKPVNILESNLNITRRKEIQRALAESEQRLAGIVVSAMDGIITIDARQTITLFNPAAEKIFGYSADQVIGKRIDMLIPERFRDRHASDVRRFGQSGVTRRSMGELGVVSGVRADGEEFPIEASISQVDVAGEKLYTVILRDITDRKRAEEGMLRSQKLEALGTLSGGIAHDFNNILLAINENARLALEDVPPGSSAQESLEEISKAGRRAADLIRRILAFSRPAEQEKKVAQLEPVVEDALKLLRATLPATVNVETQFSENLPPVSVDAAQIYQVVINLLTNSADALDTRPGTVKVSLEPFRVGSEQASVVPDLHPGDYVLMRVQDDGAGMDPETMKRIFDPFFTTKPVGKGTGLGLSIVHGVMRGHGGAVTVYSEPGKGTAFNLYFPVANQAGQTSTSPAEPPRALQQLRVLYVDDEEALVKLAGRVLKKLGYSVTGFTDPEQAVQAFEAAPDQFDIAVTDLAMPHLSGFDVSRRLLSARRTLPIVMTSGYVRTQDQELAELIGVRELILKPSSIEDLGRALDRIFREAAGRNDGARRTR